MSGGGTVVEEDHSGEREKGHGLGDGRLADHDIRDGQERLQYMGVVTQGLGELSRRLFHNHESGRTSVLTTTVDWPQPHAPMNYFFAFP